MHVILHDYSPLDFSAIIIVMQPRNEHIATTMLSGPADYLQNEATYRYDHYTDQRYSSERER